MSDTTAQDRIVRGWSDERLDRELHLYYSLAIDPEAESGSPWVHAIIDEIERRAQHPVAQAA